MLTQERVKYRSVSLDNLRGAAIVLMILDHCLLVFDGPFMIRKTLTRIAMPLFFIISGHLVKKAGWRTIAIAGIGIALPFFVPFIDNPNVLFWYAVFVGPVIAAKRYPISLPIIIAVALTVAANGYVKLHGDSYDPLSLLSIMCLGAMISREQFSFGSRIPAWFGFVGRFPLSIYVLHLFALETLI